MQRREVPVKECGYRIAQWQWPEPTVGLYFQPLEKGRGTGLAEGEALKIVRCYLDGKPPDNVGGELEEGVIARERVYPHRLQPCGAKTKPRLCESSDHGGSFALILRNR